MGVWIGGEIRQESVQITCCNELAQLCCDACGHLQQLPSARIDMQIEDPFFIIKVR
jgi:hypothetical protein